MKSRASLVETLKSAYEKKLCYANKICSQHGGQIDHLNYVHLMTFAQKVERLT